MEKNHKVEPKVDELVTISELFPKSENDIITIHDIFADGKHIGYVEVGYIQKDEIKTFKKTTLKGTLLDNLMERGYLWILEKLELPLKRLKRIFYRRLLQKLRRNLGVLKTATYI